MLDPMMGVPGNQQKAGFVTDAINRILQNLVLLASKDVDVWNYYQIGVIGFGGNGVVQPALGGTLAGQDLVCVDELYENPLRVEERTRKESDGAGGTVEVNVKFPVWFDPIANGNTPMSGALGKAVKILSPWVQEHPTSYPPTVINLTDGEATDGDPRQPAEELKSLSTSDGNVVLMTLHASSNQFSQQIAFPSHDELLPDPPSRTMFEMSSLLPDHMMSFAEEISGETFGENARAMVYNAPMDRIVQALEIGTRPASMR